MGFIRIIWARDCKSKVAYMFRLARSAKNCSVPSAVVLHLNGT